MVVEGLRRLEYRGYDSAGIAIVSDGELYVAKKAGTIKFVTSGSGFHATNPQAAVFWNPASTATGNYSLKGTFMLAKPSGHTNYYGLVFGGSDLDGPKQSYL